MRTATASPMPANRSRIVLLGCLQEAAGGMAVGESAPHEHGAVVWLTPSSAGERNRPLYG